MTLIYFHVLLVTSTTNNTLTQRDTRNEINMNNVTKTNNQDQLIADIDREIETLEIKLEGAQHRLWIAKQEVVWNLPIIHSCQSHVNYLKGRIKALNKRANEIIN